MKRKLSINLIIALLLAIGINATAIAETRQFPETNLENRQPPDCRYERC